MCISSSFFSICKKKISFQDVKKFFFKRSKGFFSSFHIKFFTVELGYESWSINYQFGPEMVIRVYFTIIFMNQQEFYSLPNDLYMTVNASLTLLSCTKICSYFRVICSDFRELLLRI